jgi:hypothetical protein
MVATDCPTVGYFKSWLYEPFELAIEIHGFQPHRLGSSKLKNAINSKVQDWITGIHLTTTLLDTRPLDYAPLYSHQIAKSLR